MPHNCCPPSRRGHSWRELHADEPSAGDPALRICKRCSKIGRVSKQGVIQAVEAS